MKRRTFLQALSALPTLGTTSGISASTAPPSPDIRKEYPDDQSGNSHEMYGDAVIRAAIFPSVFWARAPNPERLKKEWLSQRQKDFPNATLPGIKTGRLMGRGLPSPDLAIALADPADPVSWDTALEHCRIAKSNGVATVLIAARHFPRWMTTSRARAEPLNHPPSKGAGLVLNLATPVAHEDLTDILGLIAAGIQENYVVLDFPHLWVELTNSQEGFLVTSTGQGATRSGIAANNVYQRIMWRIGQFHPRTVRQQSLACPGPSRKLTLG